MVQPWSKRTSLKHRTCNKCNDSANVHVNMPVVPLDGWWPWVDKEEASSDNCFLASSEEVEEVEEVEEEEEEEEYPDVGN